MDPLGGLGLYGLAIATYRAVETSRHGRYCHEARENRSTPLDSQPAQHQLLSATKPSIRVWGAIMDPLYEIGLYGLATST